MNKFKQRNDNIMCIHTVHSPLNDIHVLYCICNIGDQGCGIPIACARGEVDVKVKIKQSDVVEGPKLSVHVSLEAVHMLLYPQQLHTLLELVSSITDDCELNCVEQYHFELITYFVY